MAQSQAMLEAREELLIAEGNLTRKRTLLVWQVEDLAADLKDEGFDVDGVYDCLRRIETLTNETEAAELDVLDAKGRIRNIQEQEL